MRYLVRVRPGPADPGLTSNNPKPKVKLFSTKYSKEVLNHVE